MAHQENQMQETCWHDCLKSKRVIKNLSCFWNVLRNGFSIQTFRPSIILGSI